MGSGPPAADRLSRRSRLTNLPRRLHDRLVLVGLILGWRSGAIPQVTGLIGAIAGGAAAILSLPYLADPLSEVDPAIRPIVVLIGLVAAVAVGESIGAALGRTAARRLGEGLLGTADRTAGAAFGVAQVLLIVWLVGSLLADGPIPRLAEMAGASTAVRTMATILPPPTEIADGLGGLARRHRSARRLRRLRAVAGAARRPSRPIPRPERSPRPRRRARSR